MNYSEQILKERFEQLPKDIREAIVATPWKEKLSKISEKHNLHIDQAGHLGEETVLVMFGIEHADNLIANIAKHAEVSEEKAEAIAEDLNREIFLKVRESLKKIFEERDEEGSSFLDGNLLEKKEKDERSLLGKTGEEALNREDILREIEDKEHHNLPTVSAQELHLEARPPSEIAPFQKMKTDDVKIEEPPEMIIIRPKQEQKKPAPPQAETIQETIQAMRGDIFKDKMSGTVSVPKETVEIGDSTPPPKVKLPEVGNIDPYRERAE